MDNCKNAKFCVPTITIEIRNIETIDKSSNQILCFCLPTTKNNFSFAGQKKLEKRQNPPIFRLEKRQNIWLYWIEKRQMYVKQEDFQILSRFF